MKWHSVISILMLTINYVLKIKKYYLMANSSLYVNSKPVFKVAHNILQQYYLSILQTSRWMVSLKSSNFSAYFHRHRNSQKKKSLTLQSREHGGQGISPKREMIFSWKFSRWTLIEALAVWAVAPSFSNHILPM